MSSFKKEMKQLVKAAVRRGWVDESNLSRRKNSHYKLRWVAGEVVIISYTPSSYRAVKNAAADLRRIEGGKAA